MKQLKFFYIIFVLCFIPLSLHSELLIVKQNTSGFLEPLTNDESIKYQDIIAQVLLKYQWPMCITSNLTDQEKDELLTAGKTNAEETFIEQKLQEAIKDISLKVLFIPTCLYELFALLNTIQHVLNTNIHQQNEYSFHGNEIEQNIFSYTPILKSALAITLSKFNQPNLELLLNDLSLNKKDLYKKIHTLYYQSNYMFFSTDYQILNQEDNKLINLFSQSDIIAKLYLDKFIITELNKYLIPNTYTVQDLSNFIKNNYVKLATDTINHITTIKNTSRHLTCASIKYKRLFKDNLLLFSFFIVSILKNYTLFDRKKALSTIIKMIDLEYNAYIINKSLIVRGSSFTKQEIGFFDTNKKLPLVGTTIHSSATEKFSILTRYKNKKIIPYSISFGNSLFAGFYFDNTACALHFLLQNEYTGYALFIDKKEYINNQNNKLFFISPLSTLPALFSKGEYFHSRSTAATPNKFSINIEKVEGIFDSKLIDRHNILLLKRDPFLHAELFSQFLVKNGKILNLGFEESPIPAEADFIKAILDSQKEAEQFYRSSRILKHHIDKAAQKHRKKKQEKLIQKLIDILEIIGSMKKQKGK